MYMQHKLSTCKQVVLCIALACFTCHTCVQLQARHYLYAEVFNKNCKSAAPKLINVVSIKRK